MVFARDLLVSRGWTKKVVLPDEIFKKPAKPRKIRDSTVGRVHFTAGREVF